METHYNIEWLLERFEKGDSLKYIYFWGHTNNNNEKIGKNCFSQWFECPFIVNNITYKTSEHWMMAQKAFLFKDYEIFNKIINCTKPGEAKELGRQVLGYNDQIWNENKYTIVKLGNIHKFNQNPNLADFLLKTENRILVEASPLDSIWGIGMSHDNPCIDNVYNWNGQNLLGFILMEVRDFLKDFGLFQTLKNTLNTPWIAFPNIDCKNTFWSMGNGEEYLIKFKNYYSKLSDKEKTIFRLTNPQPYDWKTFYDEK